MANRNLLMSSVAAGAMVCALGTLGATAQEEPASIAQVRQHVQDNAKANLDANGVPCKGVLRRRTSMHVAKLANEHARASLSRRRRVRCPVFTGLAKASTGMGRDLIYLAMPGGDFDEPEFDYKEWRRHRHSGCQGRIISFVKRIHLQNIAGTYLHQRRFPP